MGISPQLFYMIVGAVLSLAQDLVPKFEGWFAALEPPKKRWVTIGLNAVISLFILGFACWPASANLLSRYVILTCTEAGFVQVLETFVFMILGNQAAFQLAPTNKRG